jgi:hypothetical protein
MACTCAWGVNFGGMGKQTIQVVAYLVEHKIATGRFRGVRRMDAPHHFTGKEFSGKTGGAWLFNEATVPGQPGGGASSALVAARREAGRLRSQNPIIPDLLNTFRCL